MDMFHTPARTYSSPFTLSQRTQHSQGPHIECPLCQMLTTAPGLHVRVKPQYPFELDIIDIRGREVARLRCMG